MKLPLLRKRNRRRNTTSLRRLCCGTEKVPGTNVKSVSGTFSWALCVVLAIAGVCTTGASLHAAPLTFRFDAEIHTVFTGIPFDSGIDFATGDVIIGTFTFQPNQGNGSMHLATMQDYQFALDVNGVVISTPRYEIEAFDDSSVEDFPGASIIDEIELSGSGFSPVDGATDLNLDPAQSSFRMELWAPGFPVPGEVEPFDGARIPGSLDVWNDFTLWREIIVSIRDGQGGAIGFQATVGPFAAVPEPSAQSVALLLFGTIAAFNRLFMFNNSRRRI